MHGCKTSLQGAAHSGTADGSRGVDTDYDVSMWYAVMDYLGRVQMIHKGVAGMLSACKCLLLGDSDFSCKEMTSEESDELRSLVGDAIMKELSQPQTNKYGMNILFGTRGYEEGTWASNTPHIQSLSWETLFVITTEVG